MARRYYYEIELTHEGLNKYRIVKAETRHELQQKANAITAQWNNQWNRIIEREKRKKNDQDSELYAKELADQAVSIQDSLDKILLNSIDSVDNAWEKLKDFSKFPEKKPLPLPLIKLPEKPNRSDAKYNPDPPLIAVLFSRKMKEFNQSNIKLFEKDVSKWEDEKKRIEQENQLINVKYNSELEKWENRKKIYEREKTENNNKIDKLYEDCKSGNVDAVEQFFMSVLETIELPFYYSKSVEIEYDPSAKIIIVDYLLPVIDDIPKLKNVSYSKPKKEFKETNHTESYMKKKYESVVYQIVMQTLNYIFSISEDFDIIDTIAFNGKINTIDKTKGKIIEPCVLSVVVCRNDFDEIFLEGVDPKAWFKSAKGVSATSLANVTPVAPILTMSRDDKRFVDGYAVSEMLDESVNLATIDWQDFENLIREIFEKEFNVNGGEVKITQASRDGGVDAVAFDPDPVRGGKIVIQAKRYNNVVGVSAVRDLYGTVLNEGAMKGILVTTSNYGNDAYNFARGKPLTLLNGANLLHLLEKHGHKAKIDLRKGKGPTIE